MRRLMLAAMACIAPLGLAAADEAKDGYAFTVYRQCEDCPELVAIPPGTFLMGSMPEELLREGIEPDDMTDERPQHAVRIGRWFSIGRFEVTRAQFAAFVQATGYESKGGCETWNATFGWRFEADRTWEDAGIPQGPDDPVVCVSWSEARMYARWLTSVTGAYYRLASESEWEYAARAGTTTARFWGEGREEACRYGNVTDRTESALYADVGPGEFFDCDDGFAQTAPVGRFEPNAWGLHDMLGNAWEWVEDCAAGAYDALYENGEHKLRPTDENANEWDCAYRMTRGGGWIALPWAVRAAMRESRWIEYRAANRGFRVVRAGPLPLAFLFEPPP